MLIDQLLIESISEIDLDLICSDLRALEAASTIMMNCSVAHARQLDLHDNGETRGNKLLQTNC